MNALELENQQISSLDSCISIQATAQAIEKRRLLIMQYLELSCLISRVLHRL